MKVFHLFIQGCIGMLALSHALAQDVKLNGITVVKVSIENSTIDVPLNLTIYHAFPSFDHSEVLDTLLKGSGHIYLRCPVRVTQKAYLSVFAKDIQLLMIPDDTVEIILKGDPVNPVITFRGKTANIQAYYLAKSKRFPTDINQVMLSAGGNARDLEAFRHQQDSLVSVERRFWNEMNGNGNLPSSDNTTSTPKIELPAWLIRYESDAMRYYDAHLRLYMFTYQRRFQHKEQQVSPLYMSFLKTIPVKNEAAMYNTEYLIFLRDYMYYKAGEPTADYLQKVLPLSKELLGERIGNFYRLSTISATLTFKPTDIKKLLNEYSFPDSSQYLVDYIKQRAEASIKKLGPGDPAPAFWLEDKLDSLISLDQFKDQVVYLSFWFAGCKPCIEEFPNENNLVEKFKDQPVKIISICTRTAKDKWLKTLDDHQLKTVSLYANPAWQKALEEKYLINSYPHYVLIGRNGKIVDNFAKRPSQDVSKDIEMALVIKEK